MCYDLTYHCVDVICGRCRTLSESQKKEGKKREEKKERKEELVVFRSGVCMKEILDFSYY